MGVDQRLAFERLRRFPRDEELNMNCAARQMGEALFEKLLAEGRHVVHIQHQVLDVYDPLQGYKPALQDQFTVDLTKVLVDRVVWPVMEEREITWRPPKVIGLWAAAKRFLKAEWDRAGKDPGVPYDGPMPCRSYPGEYEDDDQG